MSRRVPQPWTEPKLQAPGAGIPFLQRMSLFFYVKLFIGQPYRRFASRSASWEVSAQNFKKVHDKMWKETEGLSDLQMQKRVLVPSQIGLEDSSRYWSVAMCLEHVVIVGRGMLQVITALENNHMPQGKADTAAVKPSGVPSVAQARQSFQDYYLQEVPSLNINGKVQASRLRFPHPWFGKMNSREWYWLLSAHGGIHLKQIREIKKALLSE